MKLAAIMAMTLVVLAAADSASARHRPQVSVGKASLATPKKAVRLKASRPANAVQGATTKGIIMRDGGVCDPIRHMGC